MTLLTLDKANKRTRVGYSIEIFIDLIFILSRGQTAFKCISKVRCTDMINCHPVIVYLNKSGQKINMEKVVDKKCRSIEIM